MATVTESQVSRPRSDFRYRIGGMDCPSCVAKLETALGRMTGVGEVRVNFPTGTLAVSIDEARTSSKEVEKTIHALGYTATLDLPRGATEAAAVDAKPDVYGEQDRREDSDNPWWTTRKGKLVIGIGFLVAVAFVTSHLFPELSRPAYLLAAAVGIVPFARRAAILARAGSPFSIETLMSFASVGAIAIGAVSEAAVVVFLFAVGELLENVSAGHARAGIRKLISIVPRTALVEEDGKIREVLAANLALDQTVLVRPGDRIPTDGLIVDGQSQVDESPVTGESVPVDKIVGDGVFAGSINAIGAIRVRVTKTAADNTIARIIHMVEEAQASQAPMARFIDRFSARYTPAAMAVSALVIVVPPLAFGADWYTWLYRGLALLLIACPCALVLSTPAAIASGIAAGARRGLLIKGGAALEALGKVVTVAFDKTGTLTIGHPQVTDVLPFEGSEADVLAQAAAVESGSSHPIARAILEAAKTRNLVIPSAVDASAIPGKAVRAVIAGRMLSVGSPRYAAERNLENKEAAVRATKLEEEGKTVVVLLSESRMLGLIALRDEPREDAVHGIAALRRLRVRSIMLTGDNHRTGTAIASRLGLDVRAELLPAAKLAEITRMKASGPVVMVGDGINDAPALAAASVGVAMGGGTDVALETADAALLKNRVTGVAELIALSRTTLVKIRENIAISLALKAAFLVTTLLGITTLWMAILADTGATVMVTINALTLLRFKTPSILSRDS